MIYTLRVGYLLLLHFTRWQIPPKQRRENSFLHSTWWQIHFATRSANSFFSLHSSPTQKHSSAQREYAGLGVFLYALGAERKNSFNLFCHELELIWRLYGERAGSRIPPNTLSHYFKLWLSVFRFRQRGLL